jgi:hypothetical protein
MLQEWISFHTIYLLLVVYQSGCSVCSQMSYDSQMDLVFYTDLINVYCWACSKRRGKLVYRSSRYSRLSCIYHSALSRTHELMQLHSATASAGEPPANRFHPRHYKYHLSQALSIELCYFFHFPVAPDRSRQQQYVLTVHPRTPNRAQCRQCFFCTRTER